MTETKQHAGNEFDTDVVVVGAGPVGLATAVALSHHGVRVRVVERRDAPRDDSRANNLWARSQELLESIGARANLAKGAHHVKEAEFYAESSRMNPIDFSHVQSPFPTVLYSSQAFYETQLREMLDESGVDIEESSVLSDLEQDGDGVTVTLGRPGEDRGAAGPFRTLRCRYVIGADGSHSTVRELLGATLHQTKESGRATRQIDARLTWARGARTDRLWFFTSRSRGGRILNLRLNL